MKPMATKKPTKTKLDSVAQYLVKMTIDEAPSYCTIVLELSHQIHLKDLIALCNSKLLKYFRLRAKLNDNYFEEISLFDCKDAIKEIKAPTHQHPTNEYLLKHIHEFYFQPLTADSALWRLRLLSFNSSNTAYLIWKFHHCILDGAVLLEIIKELCGKKTNLTEYYKPIKSQTWKEFFNRHSIWPHIRLFNNLIRYSYNKWKHPTHKYIFESKAKLKYSLAMLELSINLVTKIRKQNIKTGKWVKHSFGNFMIAIVAEALIHFMKTNFQLTDNEIPTGLIMGTPVELRKFLANVEKETVFGVIDGAYEIYTPLKPQLTLSERLEIVKRRQDYSHSINEHHSTMDIMRVQNIMPKSVLLKFFQTQIHKYPVILSGVRLYDDFDDLHILGAKILRMYCPLPNPPYLPLGLAYMGINDSLMFMTNMDNGVCENGAKLFIDSMKFVLMKYGCLRNTQLQSKL